MNDELDPYWKLRPAARTPADELCVCRGEPPILLRSTLSANPLACLRCNAEVAPERIGFDAGLAEEVAFWTRFHGSFYYLWLESGEFEHWAAAQLSDVESVVNRRGFVLASKLSEFRRCYLWWFADDDLDGSETPSVCPKCGGELTPVPSLERAIAHVSVCDECLIAVPVSMGTILIG